MVKLFSPAKSPLPLEEQNIQPLSLSVPSRLGQEKLPLRATLKTFL